MTVWYGLDQHDYNGSLVVDIGDNGTRDAFGRIRVSNPETVLEEKNVSASENIGNYVEGGGSFTREQNRASFILAVDQNGALARRQSRQRAVYQPGKSQQVQITYVGHVPTAGVRSRIGYFDDKNGLFFEVDGEDLAFVIRSYATGTAVDFKIPRSEWFDKLDGTGASGFVYDHTKAQILNIDFQWLGVGRSRFGFVIDGHAIPCADNLWSNRQDVVYMSNPNQPVRWEIEGTAAIGQEYTLECICGKVASEGGFDKRGVSLSFGNTVAKAVTGGQEQELVAVRLNKDGDPAGIEAGIGFLERISTLCTTNANYHWRIRFSPVGPTGGTWTSPPGSFMEYSTDRTGDVVFGLLLGEGFGTDSSDGAIGDITSLVGLGYDIATQEADILSLTCQKIGGTQTESYLGSMTFRQEA